MFEGKVSDQKNKGISGSIKSTNTAQLTAQIGLLICSTYIDFVE